MKSKVYLAAAFAFISLSLNAQDSTYLSIGNVKALIYSDGNLFQDIPNGRAAYEVPKGSNSFSIFASSFWISSIDQRNNRPHYALAYQSFGNDFIYRRGPVDIVNQTYDTSAKFQRLWKIKRSEIEDHIKNWNNVGYVVPNSINDWPGNGNANTANNLAPYADLDNDNIYEPQNGEYPIIKGDEAVYLILNDYRQDGSYVLVHPTLGDTLANYSYGPLKIEMHVMLYAFDTTKEAISNTVFANVNLYNRSDSSLDDHNDLHFSVYADMDVGNASDDYVGSDSSHKMIYTYNGDNFDESLRGAIGYGNKLAAQAVQFLDHELDHAVYYTQGSSYNGDPSLVDHYTKYQRGFWKNGQSMYYGGDGFNGVCVDTNIATKQMFSGNPTLFTDTTQWTETNVCASMARNPNSFRNNPGDRRILGGPRIPKTLLHGENIEFNFAYVFAQDDDSSSHISDPVGKLFLVSDTVQDFFDRQIISSIKEISHPTFNHRVVIFPNPTKGIINIDTDSQIVNSEILNLNGQSIRRFSNKRTLDISGLEGGIYLLKLESDQTISTHRVVLLE